LVRDDPGMGSLDDADKISSVVGAAVGTVSTAISVITVIYRISNKPGGWVKVANFGLRAGSRAWLGVSRYSNGAMPAFRLITIAIMVILPAKYTGYFMPMGDPTGRI
jgi:hypothetical protein